MTRLLLIFALSGCALADCLPVTTNRVLGRDLAAADPQFAALPSTLTVGFAPSPGTKRTYSVTELERIAKANGITVHTPAAICFEIPLRPIDEETAITAMRRSLPHDANLAVVELQKTELPAGEIEFPIESLDPVNPATPGTQLWRGSVRYAETRKAAIWARVAITTHYTAVIPNKELPANAVINAAWLRIETRTGPLEREKIASQMEEVSGRVPKIALRQGSPIPLSSLADPPAVRRGDSVRVDVESGPAHLHFDAVAENSADVGDTLELRNPLNGKTFRARLESGNRAVLIVPAGQSL